MSFTVNNLAPPFDINYYSSLCSLCQYIIIKFFNLIEVFGATEDELVVLRNQKPISLAFEKWVENREVSEPYLKRAYMQYLKDTGKFPK